MKIRRHRRSRIQNISRGEHPQTNACRFEPSWTTPAHLPSKCCCLGSNCGVILAFSFERKDAIILKERMPSYWMSHRDDHSLGACYMQMCSFWFGRTTFLGWTHKKKKCLRCSRIQNVSRAEYSAHLPPKCCCLGSYYGVIFYYYY